MILGMLAQLLPVFHGFLHLILLERKVTSQHQSARRVRFLQQCERHLAFRGFRILLFHCQLGKLAVEVSDIGAVVF